MADMKKVYDDLIIINLYVLNIRNSNLFLNPLRPFDDVVRIGEIIN